VYVPAAPSEPLLSAIAPLLAESGSTYLVVSELVGAGFQLELYKNPTIQQSATVVVIDVLIGVVLSRAAVAKTLTGVVWSTPV
jgi:nitrogen regulatory protein PII